MTNKQKSRTVQQGCSSVQTLGGSAASCAGENFLRPLAPDSGVESPVRLLLRLSTSEREVGSFSSAIFAADRENTRHRSERPI